MSFTAILVDDEPLAIEGLRRFCERSGVVEVLGEATDGAAGVELVRSTGPDAVLLDIGMPGLTGLDVAAVLGTTPSAPLVVFVTAFDHFATQAFDLSVVDYVLKPVDPDRLERALARIDALVASRGSAVDPADGFWVPSRGAMVRVPTSSIVRVEAERDYVRLVADGRTHLLRASMTAIEERLDRTSFVRVHRSTILRVDAIDRLEHLGGGAWAAIDAAGRLTRIGRRHLADVRSRLGVRA